jgi:hypothetical protein
MNATLWLRPEMRVRWLRTTAIKKEARYGVEAVAQLRVKVGTEQLGGRLARLTVQQRVGWRHGQRTDQLPFDNPSAMPSVSTLLSNRRASSAWAGSTTP